MAQSIDKIQVEVEATAKGASQVVSNLTDQLKALQSALNSINTSKLSKATKSANTVKVDTSSVSKAEQEVQDSVNKIKVSLAKLNTLKNAALSGDSSSLTSFSRRVLAIQGEIDGLRERMSQIGTSVPTTAFTQLDSQIEQTKTKLEELKAKEESMGGTAVDLGDMVKVQDDIKNTETELDGLIAKQQELIYSGQAYTDPLASVRDSVDSVQQSLSDAKGEVDAFANSKPSLDVSEMTSGLSDVADKAKDAASQLWSMTKSGIKSGFSSLKSSLSKIKDTLTSIGTKASNTASTGFSKILKYGFGIRSLYVLFRRLRTAVKDSFTELQNSGAYYQTTKANVEALKNSLTTLKYQFGAAFEPIFNTVAPALQTLINYLVAVMNTISAFIAKLTGKSTYSKAVVATAEIADNTGSAAGSAAELNKQLQGFDELNNLDLDSGSSGGSGGGSSSDSSSVTYVEESVDSALTSFWDSLSDAITNGEWYKAGTLISDALTDALNSIDWDSIFEGAANFGTGLADFLNGLITDDLFSALGTTIANAIKTALIAALSFGEEFDWVGLGTAIASGINAFVEANPLSLLVSAFNTWANGILTTLISAIDGIEWTTVAQHIADAISDLDVSGIMWNLGTLANELANALYTLVSNKETWTNLGTKIGEGISSFFKSMNQVDSKTGLTGWQALGKTITSTISGITNAIKTAFETVKWEEVGQAIADFISEIDLSTIVWDLIDLAWEIVKALATAVTSLWENGDAKTKIGLAIVGLIAVAKLTGLASTLSTLIAGAVPSTIPISQPLNLSFLGKVAILAGTAAIAWEGGKSLSQWIAGKLSGTEGVSAEATSEYIKISQSYTLEMYLEEIKSAAEDGNLWDAWSEMVNDWYEPVYDEIDKAQDKNKNKTKQKDSNGKTIETGTDYNKYTHNAYTEKSGNKARTTFKYSLKLNTELTGEAKNKTDIDNLQDSFKNLTSESSKNTEAEYKAKVGGELKSIDDVTDWKTKFHALREQWKSKDATLSAKEDGIANGKVNGWIQKLEEFKKKWTGKDATFNTKESGLKDFETSKTGYLARLSNIQQAWEGKGQNRTATFTTNLSGNLGSSEALSTAASAMSTLNNSFQGNKSASFSVSLSGDAGAMNTYAGAVKNVYDNFYTGEHTASYSISISGDTSGADNWISNVAGKLASKISEKISGYTSNGKNSANAHTALGGIISGNTKFSLPQYAGGTLNAGSVFVAGESGPEVMGHINGRTEILNRSQIASIMNNSFVSAMAQFGNRMLTSPETIAYKTGTYQTYSGSDSNGNNMYVAEQNELLRQQNELLMQILEKPTGISSRDIFNATRSEANNYYNRTGNSPFI